MDVVQKLELVTFEFVANQDLDDVVLSNECKDFHCHLKVALHVVGVSKGAKAAHLLQDVGKFLKGFLERVEVEL